MWQDERLTGGKVCVECEGMIRKGLGQERMRALPSGQVGRDVYKRLTLENE